MSQADYAYYMRRADEERAHVAHALTPEAKAAHEQLCNLYLVRAGRPVEGADIMVRAGDIG